MLTLKQIHYALAIEKTRHFRKAAELCGVSQSAISNSISDLERNLGVQIFERDNKKVFVTKYGETFLERARGIERDVEALQKSAKRAKAPLSYGMRIGLIPTIAPFLLPKVLPAVREKYPELKLTLVEDTSKNLVERVKSGDLDTGVLALPYPLENLHAFSFYKEDFYAIFHESLSLAKKKSITSAKLNEHPLLLLEDGHCLKDHALAVCELNQQSQTTVVGTSLHTLIQMVLGKMGTTLIPEIALDQLCYQNPELRALHLNEPSPHRELAFITRLNYDGVKDVQSLIDVFKQALPAQKRRHKKSVK